MSNQPFYHLRPNKYIDRSMFIQILHDINQCWPIAQFRYIGFGSYHFDDFKMVHNQFGISDMVSLEGNAREYERAKYNKPYNCIEILNTMSTNYIAEFDASEKNSIIWLDYTDPSKLGSQFSDFCDLINKAEVHDIIRITLNSNPNSLGAVDVLTLKFAEEIIKNKTFSSPLETEGAKQQFFHECRLIEIKERIGAYLPDNISADDVKSASYPLLLLKALRKAAHQTLVETVFQKRFLFPISSIVYRDGQQMLTFTGIILDDHNEESEIKRCLEHNPVANFDWLNPSAIDIPSLTPKESLQINKLLPCDNAKQKLIDEFPYLFKKHEPAQNYVDYYKVYPHFHSINF